MSQFTEPFVGELVGKNLWKVYKPFEYHVGNILGEEVIKVPVGFVTNFASVPRIFWSLISPVDFDNAKPAVIHDFLYYTQKTNRKYADSIFLEALGVMKSPAYRKYLMYYSVRLFGWIRWNKLKRKNEHGRKK